MGLIPRQGVRLAWYVGVRFTQCPQKIFVEQKKFYICINSAWKDLQLP